MDSAFSAVMVLAHQQRYAEAAELGRRYLEQERTKVTWISQEFRRDQLRNTHKQGLMLFIRLKHYAEAQTHLDALIALEGSQWWTRDGPAWENLSSAAELYEGLERWGEALDTYEQAMTIFEQERHQLNIHELRNALASGSAMQYMYFQASRTALKAHDAALSRGDVSAAQDNFAQAFSAIERGKVRSLLDMMSSGALLGGTDEDETLRHLRSLSGDLATRRVLLAHEHSQGQPDQTRIDTLSREIAAAEQKLRMAEAGLVAVNPWLHRAQVAGSQVLTLDAVKAALQEDTILLQYAFLGEDLLAWAITHSGKIQTHRTKLPDNALRRDIRAFHWRCQHGELVADLGQTLAAMLLTPFDQVIAEHPRMIVVPYGVGYLLPFHALPWYGQPLAATHTISYLPSASFIQLMHFDTALVQPQRVLAVGNPTNMCYQEPGRDTSEHLTSLPSTEAEATYVASLLPGGKALLGEQATAAAVRAEIDAYSILHFATYCHLSAQVPLRSAIILAGSDILTVYELMGLHLHADLVVLSACRTDQRETIDGDDIMGLSRALLSAGARTVLISLWPVADAAASILMGEFYRHLRVGDPPAVALQVAQTYLRTLPPDTIRHELEHLKLDLEHLGAERSALATIDESLERRAHSYSHPFYWASFILVGI